MRRHDGAHRIEKLAKTGADPGARPAQPGGKAGPSGVVLGEPDLDEPSDGPIDIEQHAFDRLSSYVIETFGGYKMQRLVAAVLTAEGFTCTVPGEGADQGVDVLSRVGQFDAAKGQPGLGRHRSPVQRHHHRPVARLALGCQHRGRPGEHLERADQVQRLHSRKADNQHFSCHTASVGDDSHVVYAMHPTNQDTSG